MNGQLNIFGAESRGAKQSELAPGYRHCRECGNAFSVSRKASLFCTPKCRSDWSNRRNMRGAQLYDLHMAMRFERDAATKAGVWKVMNRLASDWRDEDNRERDGRRSWGDWKAFLSDRPYLYAVHMARNWAGRLSLKPATKKASK